jgi:hypothetical protein
MACEFAWICMLCVQLWIYDWVASDINFRNKNRHEEINIEPIISTTSFDFELASKLYKNFYIVHQSTLQATTINLYCCS